MQKITPFLWFESKAEDAVNHYVSIFKNSKITQTNRYGEAGARASGQPKGAIMTIAFQLDGQEFVAINGGPVFKFSPAISFVVNCESQEELDAVVDKLAEGGEISQCGWLTDKFGVTWQVTPAEIGKWMQDPVKAERVMNAVLPMKKIDIATLRRAYEQS